MDLITPRDHQRTALARMDGQEYYALFAEQGTGKTAILLWDAEREFLRGKIDGVLVVAPNGVHSNWIRRELAKVLRCPYYGAYYRAGTNKRRARQIEHLLSADGLRILAINIEALTTKAGSALAERFVSGMRVMMVVDESHRISNPRAACTKACEELRPRTVLRRIATGTPIGNAPINLFSQFEFLRPGLLGTRSYRAFVAEYAHLVPDNSPLMRTIQQRSARARNHPPQVIARDRSGRKRWRNIEKLQELIAPYTFRVRKAECLDLPPKIYKSMTFELSPTQRKHYDSMENDMRIEFSEAEFSVPNRLAAYGKLQQITSGFIMVNGEPLLLDPSDNPRMELLIEAIADIPEDEQFVVWARYKAELRAIATMLRAAGISVVEYHGDIPNAQREEARALFDAGEVRAFVGQQQAGGTGLNELTAATTTIYYSNTFRLIDRQQSEDRTHRDGSIGKHRVYIDLIAEETIDEQIVDSLLNNEEVSARVLRDPFPVRGIAFAATRADNSPIQENNK